MPTPYFDNYATGSVIYCDITDGECNLNDSLSRIVCSEINILPCSSNDPSSPCSLTVVNNGTILCDCGDTVNCDLCGSDLPYFNPVVETDTLYFQFQQIDTLNGNDPSGSFSYGWGAGGFVDGYIKDCCTGDYLEDGLGNKISILDYANDFFVGVYPVYDYSNNPTWLNLQSIDINVGPLLTDLLNAFPDGGGCFTIEFCFYITDPSKLYCLCSEPFKLVPCTKSKPSLLLRGDYPIVDCFNYYYGTEAVGNGFFNYLNYYRVPGVLEQTNFEITKEVVGPFSKPVSTEILENYTLKTYRVPSRVAKIVTNILASATVFIDGFEYRSEGEISKNNETGKTWFIEANIVRRMCGKSLSCGNSSTLRQLKIDPK